jgi:hypothetical protein
LNIQKTKFRFSSRILPFLFLFHLLLTGGIFAQNRELLVKAAYIEKFSRFTTWPEQLLTETFNIAIIGQDPFENTLPVIFDQYKIKNLPVKINYIEEIKDLGKCHVLIISNTKKNNLADILTYLKGKPVLTIGSSKSYGTRGVHFNFYTTEKGTIHFEINPSKIKESGLLVDMYLLELGRIIGG